MEENGEFRSQSRWIQNKQKNKLRGFSPPGFDSRRYQIFWEVVGLERGPLSLVRITEELLEWKVAASV
jgi:hypothetical protein